MSGSRSSTHSFIRLVASVCLGAFVISGTCAAPSVESDWLSAPQVGKYANKDGKTVATTESDAIGGCDGIKNGEFGFHTDIDDSPWWQVDLEKSSEIGKVIIYNRCIYPERPAKLKMLLSDDGKDWKEVYQHDGTPFWGVKDGDPLTIDLKGAAGRFVRIQLPNKDYLHFDEVEVYSKTDPDKNIALGKPADQSSVSPWSVAKSRVTAYPVQEVVDRGVKLAYDLRTKGVNVDAPLKELETIALQARNPKSDTKALYISARKAVRELVFSNPLINFDKILFVKRVPGSYSHMSDQNYGWWSRPGGGLYIMENIKSGNPKLRCLTESLPDGSVNSPDLSYDGRKILFAYCKYYPETAGMDKLDKSKLHEDGFYHIFEVNVDGTGLKQLTKGKYDDFFPRYLPDGNIVFLSTRRGQDLQCNVASAMATMSETKLDSYVRCGGDQRRPVAIYTLHKMTPDGKQMTAISAFESFEWTPQVDEDGKIIYARWDYVDRTNGPFMKLWSTNPDGTNPKIVWGNYTSNPHCTFDARRIPGTGKYMAIASPHHSITGGSVIEIDPSRAMDGLDSITRLTPDVCFPETEGWPNTFYANPYPLSEDYFLVAWSNKKLVNEGGSNFPDGMGIYLGDSFGNLELIYRDPEISSMFPIPLRPRKQELQYASSVDWKGPQVGSYLLTDVYKGLTGIEKGTIKSLRIVAMPAKAQPWINSPSIGFMTEDPGKCILGTVPVEADGSAHFNVPSGVAVFFQALDKDGMAVQTMRSLTYVQPGEKLSCVGCHENRLTTPPHASRMPLALSRKPSKIALGPEGSWPLDYTKLVQPVLDRHCVKCHGSEKDIKLTADKSYDTLTNFGSPSVREQDNGPYFRGLSVPGEYGARVSSLMKMLDAGHHRVKLDQDSRNRLVTWIDTYAQRSGHFSPDQEKQLVELKERWASLVVK